MREPQRLLCRLNALAVGWEMTGRTTGDVLSAQDIAACLAGLKRGPYLLLRYLWCHDETVSNELYALLLSEIIHLANRHHWSCKKDTERLSGLMQLALNEIKYNDLCKTCHGTGILTHTFCSRCDGSGKKKYCKAKYARACGINPANWERTWAQKYHEIYLSILQWNELGINHLLRKLS